MQVDPRLPQIDDALYRVAAKAFIVQGGKALLGFEPTTGGEWNFPGGGIDYDLDLIEGLKLELKQELGLNEEDYKIHETIAHVEMGHEKSGIPRMNVFFYVDVLIDPSEFELVDEVEKVDWFDFDAIPNTYMSPATGDLNRIRDVLKSR